MFAMGLRSGKLSGWFIWGCGQVMLQKICQSTIGDHVVYFSGPGGRILVAISRRYDLMMRRIMREIGIRSLFQCI